MIEKKYKNHFRLASKPPSPAKDKYWIPEQVRNDKTKYKGWIPEQVRNDKTNTKAGFLNRSGMTRQMLDTCISFASLRSRRYDKRQHLIPRYARHGKELKNNKNT
ncbi:MAG: hypothetical protein NTW25_02490 [Candidatus Kapabacteria bacterium]|nr:hypothetical protein [Candidatus Kapabacteria bacterium]